MFKILFGKKLEEFDKTIQRQQELEIEIQKLKQQLDDTCEAINVQSETYNKKLEETVEKQSKKNEGLNNQIQAANGWIKDTREKMWSMSSDIAELKKEQIHLKNELEKQIPQIQSNADYLKDTREKIWPMSSDIAELRKELNVRNGELRNELNAQKRTTWNELRKLEEKQKRYCPEEKYELAVSDWYREKTGRDIDIKRPKTYNEIIQWAKIHENTEEKSRLSDKYAVREWIKEKIGEEYLIPILGVYNSAEEIDFDILPQQFVLKCNHGSAYNIIVKDKNTIDKEEICKKLNNWLREDFVFKNGIELHYERIKPCIIAEEYMIHEGMDDLPDYKFFCFGGKVFCSFTIDNIKEKHTEGRLGIFDKEYNLLPYHRADFTPITEQLEKPVNYDKMVELAELLAEGFSHVRVDFYNINGKIYFGEMTFTTGSGRGFFEPDEFDYILGEQWLKYLPELNNK